MADERSLTRAPKQPYDLVPPAGVRQEMVTTAFNLDGFRIRKNLGVVRGIVVRSPSIGKAFLGAFKQLAGGNIKGMRKKKKKGDRLDATEIMGGVSEVLAYGTAVVVEPDSGAYR